VKIPATFFSLIREGMRVAWAIFFSSITVMTARAVSGDPVLMGFWASTALNRSSMVAFLMADGFAAVRAAHSAGVPVWVAFVRIEAVKPSTGRPLIITSRIWSSVASTPIPVVLALRKPRMSSSTKWL